jgi:hypothetical protein
MSCPVTTPVFSVFGGALTAARVFVARRDRDAGLRDVVVAIRAVCASWLACMMREVCARVCVAVRSSGGRARRCADASRVAIASREPYPRRRG